MLNIKNRNINNSMKVSLVLFLLVIFVPVFSQDVTNDVRKGNKLYNDKQYGDAEVMYRKGQQKDKFSVESTYNLGNALYKQQNYEAAASEYKKATVLAKEDKTVSAKVYHNLGNALFYQNKYADSVEAYKMALKNNPKDDETRKNLVIAQKKLQEQQNSSSENKEQNDKKEEQPPKKKIQIRY